MGIRMVRGTWKVILVPCLALALVGLAIMTWNQVPKMMTKMSQTQPEGCLVDIPVLNKNSESQEPKMTTKMSQPQPEGRLVDIPVLNKDSDMCKEWTGEASQATEWWHWACLMNRYFATVDYTCRQPVHAGNWKMCMDVPWSPPSPCLVYSVGIANHWAFDDYMFKRMNCTVHSFDPSMGKPHFMRDPKNLFYNIGLGWEDNGNFTPRKDGYVGTGQKWTMMTLQSIMEYLGHQNLVLDFLKVDIELSEWPVLEYLLQRPQLMSQIRQFAIEWHIFPNLPKSSEFEQMYRNLLRLRDMGFYAFHNAPFKWINRKDPAQFNSQSEISYVNMGFLKKDKKKINFD